MDNNTPAVPLTGAGQQPIPSAPWYKNRRRLVLVILAVVALVAAVFYLGPIGLIPFGLLLAFSTD